jgi:hypothetical protein
MAQDNKRDDGTHERALANLAQQRDDLIRTLADKYNERDEALRLERLLRIEKSMKFIAKAMKQRDNERLIGPDEEPEDLEDT